MEVIGTMKKKIKLIKDQIYLATHQRSFWVSSFILLGYVMITFIYYCISYFHFDAASTLAASEMYAFNGNAPFGALMIMIIPMLCAMNFGYQNSENRKNLTYGLNQPRVACAFRDGQQTH